MTAIDDNAVSVDTPIVPFFMRTNCGGKVALTIAFPIKVRGANPNVTTPTCSSFSLNPVTTIGHASATFAALCWRFTLQANQNSCRSKERVPGAAVMSPKGVKDNEPVVTKVGRIAAVATCFGL